MLNDTNVTNLIITERTLQISKKYVSKNLEANVENASSIA